MSVQRRAQPCSVLCTCAHLESLEVEIQPPTAHSVTLVRKSFPHLSGSLRGNLLAP